MATLSEKRQGLSLAIVLTTFILPAIISLAILAVRAVSVLEPRARHLATSGGESISIYNVMKIHHGLSLYEDPRRPPFYTTTLYNAGFYQVYGAIGHLISGSATPDVSNLRFITLAFACLGTAGLLAYSLLDLGRRKPGFSPRLARLTMISAAVSAFLGTMPGWWLLTVRPDIGAAAFGALAVAAVFACGPEREWTAGLAGGVCLAVAWSFKQSNVFVFVGLLMSALLNRRFRLLAALALPVAMTVLMFATWLGPDYRYNAFFATSLSSFDPRNLVKMAVRVPVKGAFPLAAAIASLPILSEIRWLRRDEALALRACWWTCLIGAMMTCCRNGSEVNYFFEFWVIVGYLAVIQARFLTESVAVPGRRLPAALLILTVVSISSSGIDAARLILPPRFGTLQLHEGSDRAAELTRVRTLLKKETGAVFCQPALWGLAWSISFPSYVFDDYAYFHEPAQRRDLLAGGGPAGLIAKRHFRMMVLELDDRAFLDAATAAGYQRQPGWSSIIVLTSPLHR